MKKTFILLTLAANVIAGSSVLAAEYDINDKYVSDITGDTYRTILILKKTDQLVYNEIAYIGQARDNEMITSAMRFYLNENVADGDYLVKLGGKDNDTSVDELRFTITSPLTYGESEAAKVFRESDAVAFGWEDIENISEYNSILIQIGDKVLGISMDELPTIQGEGGVSIGVKITDVANVNVQTKAYISKSIFANDSLVTGKAD